MIKYESDLDYQILKQKEIVENVRKSGEKDDDYDEEEPVGVRFISYQP